MVNKKIMSSNASISSTVMAPKVVAVIVLYYPDLDKLQLLIDALSEQVESVVIVNNGNHNISRLNTNLVCVKYINNQENLGIATALNQGVQEVNKLNADFVIFFDQDSSPPENLVEILLQSHAILVSQNKLVAGVGPKFYNEITQKSEHFYCWNNGKKLSNNKTDINGIYNSDFMITSGSMISLDVLKIVGLFDGDLFIDYVDTEWNFRAKSKGYLCYGVESTIMKHSLGDRYFKFLGCVSIFLHSKTRVFFQIRNARRLLKKQYIPKQFLIKNLLIHTLLYTFVSLKLCDHSYLKSVINAWRVT